MAAVFLVVAAVVLWLEIAGMRHVHHASLQSAGIVEPAPRAPNLELLFATTFRELSALCDLRACWFERFPFDTALPRIEPGRILGPAEEPGVPAVSYAGIELPVRLNGLTLGRIVLLPSAQSVRMVFTATARERAIAMAAELAAPVAAALTTGKLGSGAGAVGPGHARHV
jgi:hypothetical protein